ncbi:hypothetical protein [Streptomyces sp. NBC_00063]|uniref:hypothetical protein n=1 Tax=Streptomyces sp. NBC_00063 TaxID=2975638 RepID=UPI002250AF30|nr:hypothetical protein [Streptomyces sp. NBC_00063]MCX5439430.1 hypothetical protein [Streptomyces sp. NBC_00063]
MQRARPRLLHGSLINRHDFTGCPSGSLGDKGTGILRRCGPAHHGTSHLLRFSSARHGTGRLRGTTGRFSRHHIGNGGAVTGTLIGARARNRRPVSRALTVPGEELCGVGHVS